MRSASLDSHHQNQLWDEFLQEPRLLLTWLLKRPSSASSVVGAAAVLTLHHLRISMVQKDHEFKTPLSRHVQRSLSKLSTIQFAV